MSDYKKAVKALAKGIEGKNSKVDKQKKTKIARELLHSKNPGNHGEWSNIEIKLDPDERKTLQNYLAALQDAYNEEIGKDINQTIRKVEQTTKLRDKLQKEVNQALSETKELEKIAKRLQDKGIGKIAGKEEDQINQLGKDLERINREGKELEKDKQKITQILNHHNLDQNDLHPELKRRASAIGTILQAAGSGTGGSGSGSSGTEWKELLDNPKRHITPNKSLGIQTKDLNHYKNGRNFSRSPKQKFKNYKLPEQGFKLHITATPDEGYDLVKELIPILQAKGIRHKIMRSREWMEDRLDSHGDTQALKLMTIYPKADPNGPDQQAFKPGDKSHNEEAFFLNEKHTREVVKLLLNEPDQGLIKGGPKLVGTRKFLGAKFNAEEFRVKNTRVHLTYSIVSSMARGIIKNGKTIDMEHWVRKKDSNGNFIDKSDDDFPFPKYIPSNNFRKTGNGYFLGHLKSQGITKKKSENIKEKIARADDSAGEAILGLDGKVAGAHYLPPPEGIERIEDIIKSV